MAFGPRLRKAYWSLAGLGAVYFGFLACLLTVDVQRNALYAHKYNPSWWQKLDKYEQWGFMRGQIQPFYIKTADDESLYAWLIVPVGAYAKHEEALIGEPSGTSSNVETTAAFRLLHHGNAGTVAQGWRTDTYRALSSANAEKTYVLTADYRGFGQSTGCPTEEGLIADGTAMLRWAMHEANLPPERIVLVGQSLGTAVAAAVAERFAAGKDAAALAGVVLVAPFTDLASLLLTYAIGGIVPILSPLRPYPPLQRFFSTFIADTWRTSERVTRLIQASEKLDLVIVHAKDDFEIPWKHSEALFHAAARAMSGEDLSVGEIDEMKRHEDLGASGWRDTWSKPSRGDGGIRVVQQIVRNGGHNRVVTYAPVVKAVYELLYE